MWEKVICWENFLCDLWPVSLVDQAWNFNFIWQWVQIHHNSSNVNIRTSLLLGHFWRSSKEYHWPWENHVLLHWFYMLRYVLALQLEVQEHNVAYTRWGITGSFWICMVQCRRWSHFNCQFGVQQVQGTSGGWYVSPPCAFPMAFNGARLGKGLTRI